ncbi:MAG: hypothetical protein J6W52_09860 [Bacteroidaceae bacterium]|nr:hypothetical protein [Bacteroidaceae bacterium]
MKNKLLSLLKSVTLSLGLLFGTQMLAEDVILTALSGTPGYSGEDFPMLVDGSRSTKWCMGDFNGAYIVFKGDHAFVPTSYTLITGLDTRTTPDRNWKSWKVYAANFESDEDATRDAEGWTLIDVRQQLTEAEFPAENNCPTGFTCTENPTKEYQYFKVELEEIVGLGTGKMQMSEFTFSEPAPNIPLTAIKGRDSLWGDGAYGRLVDNNQLTKWGGDNTPIWVILKAEEPIHPDFYRVLTANDTDKNPDRNWKDWTMKGANFDSDEEATYESNAWVTLDDRKDALDRFPKGRYMEAIFGFNQSFTESYQYYLINITATGGNNKMQMAEFSFGFNKYELNSVRNSYYQRIHSFNPDVMAQKSLTEAYAESLNGIFTAQDVEGVIAAYTDCTILQEKINASYNAYLGYVSAVSRLRNEYDEGHLNSVGKQKANAYLSENVAPNADFVHGSSLYILEQLTLSVEELDEEISFINNLLAEYSSELGDPIEVIYEGLDGTEGFANEDYTSLFDGTESTKWCTSKSQNYVIFAASEPIKPTFYKLITANDTDKHPERNWTSWRIYAANFESNEDVARESDQWVLIDEKLNIGTDLLPGAKYAPAYFYLSNAPTKQYTYFKIEIAEIVGGSTMQMSEFTFGNQANFFQMRDEFVEDFSYAVDFEVPAYRPLIEQYQVEFEKLKKASSINSMSSVFNTLTDLVSQINKSQEDYINYETKVLDIADEIAGLDGPVVDFLNTYINEEIGLGFGYPNGTYPYIMANCQLDGTQLATEVAYLNNLLLSAQNGAYVGIEGTKGAADKEGFAALVDGDTTTKWCVTNFAPEDTAICVFKVSKNLRPFYYALVTGNDTGRDPERNWLNWKVFGANFESDAAAKADAEGWTLVDQRDSITTDRLPAANYASAYFGLNVEAAPAYQYYKVEVTDAVSGNIIQMSEFTFGDKEEFGVLQEEYVSLVQDFSTDIVAQQALLDDYAEHISDINDAQDADQLMEHYIVMKKKQDTILASEKAYEEFDAFIAQIETALLDNPTLECDEVEQLRSYIDESFEYTEQFPHGSYTYILEEHVLPDSVLAQEKEMIEKLYLAAVRNGYTAGSEITSMLANADFSNNWEGWEGKVGYATGKSPEGIYAAEGNAAFDIHQTLTGIKNGVYEFVVNAGYRPSNQEKNNNLAAYIYANDNQNYIMSVFEGKISVEDAIDGVNCHISGDIPDREITDDYGEVIGYALHGVQSMAYAIAANRHENHIVALVKYNTLTVGIKDPGTGANWDWTGFGNARLFYLGTVEQAVEGIDRTLSDMANRGETLMNFEAVLDENSTYEPNFGADKRAALAAAAEAAETANTTTQKLAVVEQYTELFRQISADRLAYRRLLAAVDKVEAKWMNQPLDDATFGNLSTDLDEKGWNAYQDGAYTAEEAEQTVAYLYATYPDYLELNVDKALNSVEIEEQTEAFTYSFNITGANPFAGFTGFYEDLTSDQYFLHFQYKASRDITDGEMFFANPNLNGSYNLLYGTLAQTDEWRDAFLDLSNARKNYGWGSANHWIRWDFTNGDDLVFQVRNIRMITEAQAAELGDPAGISSIDNGKLTIDNAAIYDLAGRRVANGKLKSGIYIINGKKVAVK